MVKIKSCVEELIIFFAMWCAFALVTLLFPIIYIYYELETRAEQEQTYRSYY